MFDVKQHTAGTGNPTYVRTLTLLPYPFSAVYLAQTSWENSRNRNVTRKLLLLQC